MKCTCVFCKAKIEKATAYHKEDEKGRYYCNEEHFNAAMQKKADKEKKKNMAVAEKSEYDAIFEQTKKIFGYEFQSYGMLRKEVKNWEKLGSRKKILIYLQENEVWLTSLMNKDFTSDFHRVRYYSAVIVSKLHDYKEPQIIEPVKITVNCEMYEPAVNTKKKRKGLSELEDEVI